MTAAADGTHAHPESTHAHPETTPDEHPVVIEASEAAITRTAEVFRALATPSRLKILMALSHGRQSVTDVVEQTHLSQPLVSQHLKLLRGLHLVDVERVGREAFYFLKDDHVAHVIVDALAHSDEDHD